MMLTNDFDIKKLHVRKSLLNAHVIVTYDDTDMILDRPAFDSNEIELSSDEIMYHLVGTDYNDAQVNSVQALIESVMR